MYSAITQNFRAILMYTSNYFARYLRNDNFEDTSLAIASNKIKLDYPASQVKAFLDICYGVPTKLSSIELAKVFNFSIYLQADRVIKTVGQNLLEAAEKNGRLWVAILFAFDHLADPSIRSFFCDRADEMQSKIHALKYRDYLTKMDYKWLIAEIRSWEEFDCWET